MNMVDQSSSLPACNDSEFTSEQLARVQEVINSHKNKPGSLIPVLEDIQEILGFLPREIQEKVSAELGIPLSEVYGVATFYHFFTLVPRGRHLIRCCLGTACYVRGGAKNMDKLTSILQIKPGETTEDRRFSLETVRCVGACGLAPALVLDEETFSKVKPSKLNQILDQFE